MKFRTYITGLALSILAGASSASAAIIPFGLQSNISQATLNSWGWTEIHRSSVTATTSEAAIVAAATGDYLMMAIWDITAQQYAILGAGETSAVTAVTYLNGNSDNNGNYNPNWSNGLNFYRTQNFGSWGFTTNSVTELNSADIFLLDGLQAQNGNTEGVLSAGLSMHTASGNLTAGWAYNVTGNNFQNIYGNQERVFFTANASNVPDSGTTLALMGLALTGIGLARRFRR